VQGVRRPCKSLRVADLSEVLKYCCCRSRPLNSLKDKRREDAIGSPKEASQVGEQVNESHGETLLHFMDSQREERMVEIL
jgi:hypothetical protein